MSSPETVTLPPVGSRVKLTADGPRWWDVRCADERFAILTRQAEFRPKGEVCYTILDIQEGVRGPCNLIGQGWDKYMSDEKCAELLIEVQVGSRIAAKTRAWNEGDHSFDLIAWLGENDPTGHQGVEISHRNRVALDVGPIRETGERQ